MFRRITRTKYKGKVYEYLKVVESYRDTKGKVRQRVVLNLGNLKELKGGKLDEVIEELRKLSKKGFVLPGEIRNDDSVPYGAIVVARRLWEEMELDRMIRKLCGEDVAERAFVLVANRLTEPRSEHGLARWLEQNWVCDSKGERFVPKWRDADKVTKEKRVKVEWDQLERWYRSLDAVCAQKKEIERELYLRLRDLLNFRVDMVFYDITSLSFAGKEEKGELKRHGYSRDGRPRDVQVLLGLVMVKGFPIAGHVFRGNVADKTTVKGVVEDIEERFGIKETIFVADQGMVSKENLLALVKHRYILGHKGRRDNEARRWFRELTDNWRECSPGVRVQPVQSATEGARAFVVDSAERKQYEERLRKKCMERAERHLQRVAQAVREGRLKSKEAIAVSAQRALHKDKGYRYFSYTVPQEGRFHHFLDEKKINAETVREGRYILTTNVPDISPEQVVAHYKELWEIEAGFREFKDVIQGRPVYHQRDDRICAHLFIAQIALLLLRCLRHRLDEKGLPFSPQEALAAVKSIGVADLDLKGKREVLVSTPKPHARQVLSALTITNLTPGSTRKNRPSKTTKTEM